MLHIVLVLKLFSNIPGLDPGGGGGGGGHCQNSTLAGESLFTMMPPVEERQN